MKGEPIVQIAGLHKSFRRGSEQIDVLIDLNLEVPEGEFLALMGPSGSGKTTLLNLIAGLDSPTRGSIRVGDERQSAVERPREARARPVGAAQAGSHDRRVREAERARTANGLPSIDAGHCKVDEHRIGPPAGRDQVERIVAACGGAPLEAERREHMPQQLAIGLGEPRERGRELVATGEEVGRIAAGR